jgi:hypothetical protein
MNQPSPVLGGGIDMRQRGLDCFGLPVTGSRPTKTRSCQWPGERSRRVPAIEPLQAICRPDRGFRS